MGIFLRMSSSSCYTIINKSSVAIIIFFHVFPPHVDYYVLEIGLYAWRMTRNIHCKCKELTLKIPKL